MKGPWEDYATEPAATEAAPWESYTPSGSSDLGKVGKSYAKELTDTLVSNDLFNSTTSALQGARDKSIRRREDGDWDLPNLKKGSGLSGAIVSMGQKFGDRLPDPKDAGLRASEIKDIQKVFHDFQQANNLSDEEVQTAWSDLGNMNRTWGEDEKFRVLSNGAIIPNPGNSDWLDTAKAADMVRESDAPAAAKSAMLRGLPQLQAEIATEKIKSYEAGMEVSNIGTGALSYGEADEILTPSAWADANGRREDFGTKEFVRDYEGYVQSLPWAKRKTAALAGRNILGFNKIAVTALGLAGMAGSDTATGLAAAGSEAGDTARRGMEPTGIVGQVIEELPSVLAQVLPARLLGTWAALAPKGAQGPLTALGVYGSAGAQSAGLTYADEIAQGTPEDEAREKAAKAGVSTAIITPIFGSGSVGGVERVAMGRAAEGVTVRELLAVAKDQGIKNLAKSKELRSFATGVLKASLGEATEEGVDQLLQSFLTADPDDSLAEAWSGAIDAGIVGGAIGGTVDVGSKAAQSLAMEALPDAPDTAREALKPVDAEAEEPVSPEGETTAAGEAAAEPVVVNETPVGETQEGLPVADDTQNPPVTPSETRRGEESETDAPSPASPDETQTAPEATEPAAEETPAVEPGLGEERLPDAPGELGPVETPVTTDDQTTLPEQPSSPTPESTPEMAAPETAEGSVEPSPTPREAPTEPLPEGTAVPVEAGAATSLPVASDNGQDISQTTPEAPVTDEIPTTPQATQEPGSAPSTTSLKNEATDADLKALGFEPIAGPERRSDESVMDAATEAYTADPQRASRIVSEVLQKPRTLSDLENGIVMIELANRKIAQGKAQKAYFGTVDNGGSESEQAAARAELDKARQDTLDAIRAAKLAGTEWGRAGAFRKRAIEEDYSLAAMEARFRIDALNGGKLSPEQEKLIADMAEKLRAAQDRSTLFDEAEEAKATGDDARGDSLMELAGLVETLTNDITRAQEKAAKKARTSKVRKVVHARLDPLVEAARARLAERGRLRSETPPADDQPLAAGLTPEVVQDLRDAAVVLAGKLVDKALTLHEATIDLIMDFGEWVRPYVEDVFKQAKSIYNETAASVSGMEAPSPETVLDGIDPEAPLDKKDVWDLARAHVIAGARGKAVLDAVFDDLSKVMPDITRDQVAEAFTGYGKVVYPSKNEASKELQRIKTIERLTLQLQDVLAGRMPKRTGYQRGEQDAEARELNKKIREALRDSGLQVTDPEKQLQSVLGAMKRRMRNEIEELQRAIDSKTPRPSETRTPTPLDEEALGLKSRLEAKRKEYDSLFGGKTTLEKRVSAALKSLDRQIAEEEQMIKDGVLKKPAAERLSTPEIEARREKLRKMREHRRELYAAENPVDPLEQAKEAARAAGERLQARIDANDVATRKKQTVDPDAELQALWDANEALRDQIAEMRKALPLTDGEAKAAIEKAIADSERTAKKIQAKLDSGDLSVESKPLSARAAAVAADQRVKAARQTVKNLNKELAARRRAALPKLSPEEKRLKRILDAAKRQQADLRRRIAERDVTPKEKPGPFEDPKMRDAARQARRETNTLKRKFNEIVLEEALKQAPPLRRAAAAATDILLRLPRAVMASMDVSGIGRQGFSMILARPKIVGKNLKAHFAFSEKAADKYQSDLENDPNFDLAENSGLAVQSWRPGHKLHEMEEAYRSRLAKNIPGVAHSERAYVTYLNSIRMAYFNELVNHLRARPDGMTPANLKAVAKFVNNMTGRGTLGKWDKSTDFLADVFFSPRFVASRFALLAGMAFNPLQMVTGYKLGKKETQIARQVIGKEYTRLTVGASLLFGLLALGAHVLGGDDDEDGFTFSLDPLSSDFGKIKVGESRFDMGGGMLQPLVFLSRFTRGKKRSAEGGEIQLVGPDKDQGQSRLKLAGQFSRSKLSPTAGFLVDETLGKDFLGNPVYMEDGVMSMFIPLPIAETYENYRSLGVGGASAAAMANMFGIGSSTYGPMTDAQYNSSLSKDINANILFPLINSTVAPEGKEVNPDRYESDPDYNEFFTPKR